MAAIKMINETVPVHLLGSAGTIVNTSLSFGYMLCLGLGLNLPHADFQPGVSTEAGVLEQYVNDRWWRFIYILPSFLNLLMMVSFLSFINSDSIMFNLS
jgi:hypothetical protein